MDTIVNAANEGPISTGEGLTFEKVWAMFQETKLQMKETDRKIQKVSEQMEETGRRMGYLNNRFGEVAEHLVAPGILRRFNEKGYHFDSIRPNGVDITDDAGVPVGQVDILLESPECVMAVEVKVRPRKQDIEHHIKRLELLKRQRLRYHDFRKIQGAIAGAVFGAEVKQAVLIAGFFAIEQSGDTMKIDVPSDFTPREW
ncbi:MAG: hypothetical protein FWF29_04660 [Treponema sp.]|nr:hypothetical protein [Treponema sp.]